ncbi:MAG: T9SS C-terminal target domain-containing protein [Calditrichaeota bacterium]|nr:MAG: T9SS C-terminal target domain-containing protein [Calditrichota bacterium]
MSRKATSVSVAVLLVLLLSGLAFAQAPQVDILFSCNMEVQIAINFFDPNDPNHTLDVRGNFNGWSFNNQMFPGAFDPNVYQTVVRVDTGMQEYKFVIMRNGNTFWEGGQNRTYHATGMEPDVNNDGVPDAILDTVFWNNITFNDIFTDSQTVYFEVDVRPAHAYLNVFGMITYGGDTVTSVDEVHLSGNAGIFTTPELKWVWDLTQGDPSIDSLLMNDQGMNGDRVAGDSVWTIPILFEPGAPKIPVWKYGINRIDNEAGFAMDHRDTVYLPPDFRVFNQFGEQDTFYTSVWDYENGRPLGIEDDITLSQIPDNFQLFQNYPNPFNPTTSIVYAMTRPATVTIAVYDLLGHKVRTLVNKRMPAGVHKVVWDGTNDRGEAVSSGIYLYRLEAGKFTQARKMVLMR